MAQKSRIRLLRGDRANISNGNVSLKQGELLLDTTDGYILAGIDKDESENIINNSTHIVTTNRLKGYKADFSNGSQSVISENPSSDEVFGIDYDRGDDALRIYNKNGKIILNDDMEISPDCNNISIGNILEISSYSESVVIGNNSASNGNNSVCVGAYSSTKRYADIAIGSGADADGVTEGSSVYGFATAIGTNSKSLSWSSIAIGTDATADNGSSDIAIGRSAVTTNSAQSIAIGRQAKILGDNSNPDSGILSSIAIGYRAKITGTTFLSNSLAIGTDAVVNNASNAVQLGEGINNNSSTLQFGNKTIVDAGGHVLTSFNDEWNDCPSIPNISPDVKPYLPKASFDGKTVIIRIIPKSDSVVVDDKTDIFYYSSPFTVNYPPDENTHGEYRMVASLPAITNPSAGEGYFLMSSYHANKNESNCGFWLWRMDGSTGKFVESGEAWYDNGGQSKYKFQYKILY